MSALSSAGSRIVLMGTQKCANDVAAPPVPSVESTMDDLADVMANRCGADPNNIVRVQDAADPMRMGVAVAEAAEQATDVLLVHYVGHGFPGPDGELYLATRATDPSPNRLQHNSLRWDTIRKSLLNSRARTLVVILDCCFSGRAAERTLNAAEPVDLADVYGGYILTAGAREQLALAPKGQRHTAFTGELIRLLRDGDPNSPSELRMRHVYRALDRRLRARSLPAPFQRNIDQAEDLVLAANASDGTGPSTGARRIAAPRQRRRLLPTLMITTAVVLVSLGAGPLIWHEAAPDPPPRGRQAQSEPPRSQPAPPQPQTPPQPSKPPPPQQAPALPPTTTCAEHAEGCGAVPAGRSNLAADGSIVTLVENPDHTITRYRSAGRGQPAVFDGNIGGNAAQGPVVVPDERGRLTAFAIDTSGQLQYNSKAEEVEDLVRSAWHPVPDFPAVTGKPAAAQDSSGRLVVFARNTSGELWRATQVHAGSDEWYPPQKMPGPRVKDDPTVHQDRNRALRIFALTDDNKAHTWAQELPTDYYAPQPAGGGTKLATSPTVAKDGSGRLHLFARGSDNSLQRLVEDPGGPNIWPGEWHQLGPEGPHDGHPLAVADDNGTVTVFVRSREPRDRVTYVTGSGPETGKFGPMPLMEPILSALLDRDGKLAVHGIRGGTVVTG